MFLWDLLYSPDGIFTFAHSQNWNQNYCWITTEKGTIDKFYLCRFCKLDLVAVAHFQWKDVVMALPLLDNVEASSASPSPVDFSKWKWNLISHLGLCWIPMLLLLIHIAGPALISSPPWQDLNRLVVFDFLTDFFPTVYICYLQT